MQKVDARGLSCPEPVVLTKRALMSKPASLTVLVDARAAEENVTRLGGALGYKVTATKGEGYTSLLLEK